MGTIEEDFTPIRSVLQAYSVYSAVGVLLGFSVYRWNAIRASDMN